MAAPKFGRVQLKIMQVLWGKRRANAREITDAINQEEPIAHSTVQTLLRKLEAKCAIDHDAQERTFVYYALVKEVKATRSATKEFVGRVFGGSVGGLIAHLLKHERINRDELDAIKRLIDERESKQ